MAKKDKFNEVDENKENILAVATDKKVSHWGRNIALFVFLILCGAVAFLTIQLKQIKAVNLHTIQNLQAIYEQKLSKISLRVDDLQEKIKAVENTELPAEVIGISEELLNQKLELLRQEFAQYLNSDNQVNLSASPLVVESNHTKQTQEVLLASGAIIVRDLAEQGNSFEYETEVLQILARGNLQAMKYVDVMQKYAISGIKGKNQLVKSFNKIFTDLDQAKIKSSEISESKPAENWQAKIWAWVKHFSISKKGSKHPEFKQENDEIYDLVNEGDLGEALNALKTSEKYSALYSYPLEQWQKDTESYLEFKHAVTGLIMNSLANLHLKEMEH